MDVKLKCFDLFRASIIVFFSAGYFINLYLKCLLYCRNRILLFILSQHVFGLVQSL